MERLLRTPLIREHHDIHLGTATGRADGAVSSRDTIDRGRLDRIGPDLLLARKTGEDGVHISRKIAAVGRGRKFTLPALPTNRDRASTVHKIEAIGRLECQTEAGVRELGPIHVRQPVDPVQEDVAIGLARSVSGPRKSGANP